VWILFGMYQARFRLSMGRYWGTFAAVFKGRPGDAPAN
jgi:hypothetical protein